MLAAKNILINSSKRTGVPLFILILFIVILQSCLISRKLPEGTANAEADALARKVMKITGQEHWEDTRIVEWSFKGKRYHLWDRERNLHIQEWKNFKVVQDLNNKKGMVFKGEEQLHGEDADKYLEKAWRNWINDSFWLNPFWKMFDEGTTRLLVDWKGKTALMISYSSGGLTPGDSFLWILDEDAMPVKWKLWVSVIPLKGYGLSWEDWQEMSTGVKYSTKHRGFAQQVKILSVKGVKDLRNIYPKEDPFRILFK